jgi:hypothetical protein
LYFSLRGFVKEFNGLVFFSAAREFRPFVSRVWKNSFTPAERSWLLHSAQKTSPSVLRSNPLMHGNPAEKSAKAFETYGAPAARVAAVGRGARSRTIGGRSSALGCEDFGDSSAGSHRTHG